jgi:hypothetical protein
VKKSDAQIVQVFSSAKEAVELYEKLANQKNPSGEDIDRLRKLVASTPAAWPLATHTMPSLRQVIIEKMSHGPARAGMLAEMDILAKQLDYDAAPPLERLLIDHILTVRLRLIHAEHSYNQCVVNQSFTFQAGEFRDNLLSSTQARFIRAIEALARVRRLARNTPTLQINIAGEGGRQVNVQGDVNGQKATAPEPANSSG